MRRVLFTSERFCVVNVLLNDTLHFALADDRPTVEWYIYLPKLEIDQVLTVDDSISESNIEGSFKSLGSIDFDMADK